MLLDLNQYSDIALLALRLAIAAIFIYHALPKIMGAKMMAQGMGVPAGAVFILGAVELLSSLVMIFGFYIQIASLLLGIVMIGAIGMKMLKWNMPFSAMDKTGWEFDLILLAANIFILVHGGGSISIQ